MSAVRRHPLWFIGALGLAVRLFLAFHWFGNGDVLTFLLLGAETEQHPLHVYATNVHGVFWPYPPGYLLWLVGALKLSRFTGLEFQGLVQVLPIAADLAIAIAVHAHLGWRGASERSRLAGFALVMLGPAFIAISGYHGQIDPVAILPGVLAVMLWERRPDAGRAVGAGLLIGAGAVVKTVPILLLLPLAMTARSVREAARLVGAAAVLVAVVCLPFLLAEPAGFRKGMAYTGVPGRGGLSLIADPGFAADRRLSARLATVGTPNDVADWLSRAGGPITLVVLIALAAFLWRYRPALIDGVVLLWLCVFVFSPNFLLQYLVWALPFFIMAGYLRTTALLQVAVIPVLLITYLSPSVYERPGAVAYVVMMIGLWIFWAVAFATVAGRIVERRGSHPAGTQPPLVELRPAREARPAVDAGLAAQVRDWIADDPDPACRAELRALLDGRMTPRLRDRFGRRLTFGTGGPARPAAAGPERDEPRGRAARRRRPGRATCGRRAAPSSIGYDARHGSRALRARTARRSWPARGCARCCLPRRAADAGARVRRAAPAAPTPASW